MRVDINVKVKKKRTSLEIGHRNLVVVFKYDLDSSFDEGEYDTPQVCPFSPLYLTEINSQSQLIKHAKL